MGQKWDRTVIHYGHRITQRLWTEVGIFHGHADGAVAEKLLHHRKGNALHDQLAGEGVPWVVETNQWYSGDPK